MKILSAQQIREADQFTIQHEPISSINLMERAAQRFKEAFVSLFTIDTPVVFLAGPGNNGGDALAIARMLYWEKYNVRVITPFKPTNSTEDYRINFQRLPSGIIVHHTDELLQNPAILQHCLIIDGLIGSGLNRALEGEYAQWVDMMNQSGSTIISVDIPSGLFPDRPTPPDHQIVKAHYTFTFQSPKLAFLLPENFPFCGDWRIIDIELHPHYLQNATSTCQYLTPSMIAQLIKPRSKFNHKGNFGRALLMGGSKGKIGAMILAAQAALRSGIGLLTVQIPKIGYTSLQSSVPEAMVLADESDEYLNQLPELESYSSIGIGPGLGTHSDTVQLFKYLLKSSKKAMILDADALSILSEHPECWKDIPQGSILTPHFKEFERLNGKTDCSFERLEQLKNLAQKHSIVFVLKGAHTVVATHSGNLYFNSTGNPGMATGGSGDVLSGIITALLAQGYTSECAAIIGVYVHGLAADLASKSKGWIGLTPSDIIAYLPQAFIQIDSLKKAYR